MFNYIAKQQTILVEEKIKEMFLHIGFKGDISNVNEVINFVNDNKITLKQSKESNGIKYEIINNDEPEEILKSFKIFYKKELCENKYKVSICIEDII